jgi:hypothetical protein
MVELENDSDVMVPVTVSPGACRIVNSFTTKMNFSTVWVIECCQKVHERALSAAASAHQCSD